jgi:nucleoside-diphosphate-sugar epimerase
MARVLLAGFGYMGRRLAAELSGAGQEVFGLSRSGNHLPGVSPVTADLSDPPSLRALPPHIDHVVYMVSADGRDDERYRKAYVTGPKNLIGALEERGDEVRRFLFVSSTGVYEQADGSWVDESSPTSASHFSARRLLEGEEVVRRSPWPSIVLRLSGIYGPGRALWLERIVSGERSFAIDPGEYSNLIHVEDGARALAHVMTLERPEAIYIGVDSEPVERRELIGWLFRELSLAPPRFVACSRRESGRANKRCRNQRLLSTGFSFRYPTFREGLRSLMEKT